MAESPATSWARNSWLLCGLAGCTPIVDLDLTGSGWYALASLELQPIAPIAELELVPEKAIVATWPIEIERLFTVGRPRVSSRRLRDGVLVPETTCHDLRAAFASFQSDSKCDMWSTEIAAWGYCKDELCRVRCGDGFVHVGEDCDDGNERSGDGCASCGAEPGWACDDGGCRFLCGNGLQDSGEGCDDRNTKDGDGCSGECTLEPGFVCTGGLCRLACGDSTLQPGESCDDSNAIGGDGCDSACRVEPEFRCVGQPSLCGRCGDGWKMAPFEDCDTGTLADVGCEACRYAPGFAGCSADSADACPTQCGDGRVTGSEVCDDGNSSSLDGCDCAVEPGWYCSAERTRCFPCTGRLEAQSGISMKLLDVVPLQVSSHASMCMTPGSQLKVPCAQVSTELNLAFGGAAEPPNITNGYIGDTVSTPTLSITLARRAWIGAIRFGGDRFRGSVATHASFQIQIGADSPRLLLDSRCFGQPFEARGFQSLEISFPAIEVSSVQILFDSATFIDEIELLAHPTE